MRMTLQGLGDDTVSLSDYFASITGGCVVGATDPNTGDTIANCPATTGDGSAALTSSQQASINQILSQNTSSLTGASSTGLIVLGVAAIAFIFLVFGRKGK